MPDLSPELQQLLDEVLKKFHLSDNNLHRTLRLKWDHLYSLYHNVNDWQQSVQNASPRDKDAVMGDGRTAFGQELFIPYAFTTVETILPRQLSNRPKMLFLPRTSASEPNVENVSSVFDVQQSQAEYELTLQDTGKSGLMLGLGVEKIGWRRTAKTRPMLANGIANEFVEEIGEKVDFDGPDAQDVDIYDFLWDPFGTDLRSVTYVVHRTWRSTGYVLDRMQSGQWGSRAGGVDLSAQDLESSSGLQFYQQVWSGRLRAQGYPGTAPKGSINEVLEFHDGTQVITVLNRMWPVAQGPNPAWHGDLPFAIYRPTKDQRAFCGIGAIEPIEDLQLEINTLRSQRRWNAAVKLMMSFAYNEGAVDADDIRFGPAQLIPVRGDPRNLLVPLQVGDIPNSGYQEEAALQGDIERTTGISDTVTGASSAGETATGVQLVQAAANVRIQNMAWRINVETVRRVARQWLELNQQHWIADRELRLPPQPGDVNENGDPRPYSWATIGPAELAGEFDIEPDGGATTPDNVQQDRADAQIAAQLLLPSGLFDRQKMGAWIMRKMGVKEDPQQFLAPPQQIPPATLDILEREITDTLAKAGVPPEVAQKVAVGLISQATNEALDQEQQVAQQQPPNGAPNGMPLPAGQ